MKEDSNELRKALLVSTRSIILISCFFIAITIMVVVLLFPQNSAFTPATVPEKLANPVAASQTPAPVKEEGWAAPSESSIPDGEEGDKIRYGKELVAHTSAYLGPKGSVAMIANGMNCQNCHNDAGAKPFGINYSAVASTYPQFRPRSNALVSIEDRINGCFQRSMNGQKLATESHE